MAELIRTCSTLVVTSGEKNAQIIRDMLPADVCSPVSVVSSCGEARQRLDGSDVELLVVNIPLADESGYEFALDIAASTNIGVMLFVKQELFDQVCYHAEPYGIITVPKPLNKILLNQTLHVLRAAQFKLSQMRAEKDALQSKLEEQRLVNKAKMVLMEQSHMTEDSAHHYIEKEAMDRRVSRKEAATSILRLLT